MRECFGVSNGSKMGVSWAERRWGEQEHLTITVEAFVAGSICRGGSKAP